MINNRLFSCKDEVGLCEKQPAFFGGVISAGGFHKGLQFGFKDCGLVIVPVSLQFFTLALPLRVCSKINDHELNDRCNQPQILLEGCPLKIQLTYNIFFRHR